MIALSMSKCGEFCRNPTLVFATPALQHFHVGLQLISVGHDTWFLRWLLQDERISSARISKLLL
jgi:hypothetical protein